LTGSQFFHAFQKMGGPQNQHLTFAYEFRAQFCYGYDPAGNLSYRTNNALIENFQVNNLNELTTNTNGGTLTVVGTTTSPATSVTVNGGSATLYGDATFAAAGLPLTTTYTAAAHDSYGRHSGGPKGPRNQVKCLHRGYRWTKYVIPRTDPNASLRPPMNRKNSKIQGLTRQPPKAEGSKNLGRMLVICNHRKNS